MSHLGVPTLYFHLPQSKYFDYICQNIHGWILEGQCINYHSFTMKFRADTTRDPYLNETIILVLQQHNNKLLYYKNLEQGTHQDSCFILEHKVTIVDGKYVTLQEQKAVLECNGIKETFDVWDGIKTWMNRNNL